MPLKKRNIILTFCFLCLINFNLYSQIIQKLDSTHLNALYFNIAKRVTGAIDKSNFNVKKEVKHFSLRFKINSDGAIYNLEGSIAMPHTLLDTIRFFLENHIDTTLKNEINLTLIENEYILIPIAITPKFDALTLEIDNKIGVNINMIRDLYVYRSNDRKSKKYADFYPAFYTIIFAPITYPYRNIKLSKNPYEKLHKNNIH